MGGLAKAVLIYNSRTGSPRNISEILKRREKSYGKSKLVCLAAIALWI